MRHLKKSILLLVIALISFSLLFAFTEGLAKLLIFPVIAFAAFAAVYVVKQADSDRENNIKDGVRYEFEEREAEQWIKHDLAPKTLAYIKHRHWPVIIYSFVFVVSILFLWSYLTAGTDAALRNILFAGVLFWMVVLYSLAAPKAFNNVYKKFPKHFRGLLKNDWLRGYIFLFPLTFAAYVLSPFIAVTEPVTVRLLGLPTFFVAYTLIFLCAASILYLQAETKKEEEKRLRKSVKRYLNNNE